LRNLISVWQFFIFCRDFEISGKLKFNLALRIIGYAGGYLHLLRKNGEDVWESGNVITKILIIVCNLKTEDKNKKI
jgi:hypothetical protein